MEGMIFDETFDVIVIGAGHAGCEAASASARMGVSDGFGHDKSRPDRTDVM